MSLQKKINVLEEAGINRLETLVSRLPARGVTEFPLESDICDICDNQLDMPPTVDCKRVVKWITICIKEGHIEPSQPIVGRMVGWPVRPFSFSSLWTDYLCWNWKNGEMPDQFQEHKLLYELSCYLFDINEQEVVRFPSLEECRLKFAIWSEWNETN